MVSPGHLELSLHFKLIFLDTLVAGSLILHLVHAASTVKSLNNP